MSALKRNEFDEDSWTVGPFCTADTACWLGYSRVKVTVIALKLEAATWRCLLFRSFWGRIRPRASLARWGAPEAVEDLQNYAQTGLW